MKNNVYESGVTQGCEEEASGDAVGSTFGILALLGNSLDIETQGCLVHPGDAHGNLDIPSESRIHHGHHVSQSQQDIRCDEAPSIECEVPSVSNGQH